MKKPPTLPGMFEQVESDDQVSEDIARSFENGSDEAVWYDSYEQLERLFRQKWEQYGGEGSLTNIRSAARFMDSPVQNVLGEISNILCRFESFYKRGMLLDSETGQITPKEIDLFLDLANWALLGVVVGLKPKESSRS